MKDSSIVEEGTAKEIFDKPINILKNYRVFIYYLKTLTKIFLINILQLF